MANVFCFHVGVHPNNSKRARGHDLLTPNLGHDDANYGHGGIMEVTEDVYNEGDGSVCWWQKSVGMMLMCVAGHYLYPLMNSLESTLANMLLNHSPHANNKQASSMHVLRTPTVPHYITCKPHALAPLPGVHV